MKPPQSALASPRLAALGLLAAGLVFGAAPAVAQDDDEEFEDEEFEDEDEEFDEEGEDEGEEDLESVDEEATAPKAAADTSEDDDLKGSFDAVRAIEREPASGTPLIANKLHPMGLTFEATLKLDLSYSDKFIRQTGGHIELAFHIFDWLAVEGFVGAFYPQELAITKTVRQQGRSFTDFGEEPKLSDLWQSFAFVGFDVQWAPLYGKFSVVSELDLSFQLYFLAGAAIEGIAKPVDEGPGQNINNQRDFYPGLISGKEYQYAPRFSGVGGGGVRVIPWSWVAFELELRTMGGLNPAVDEVDYPELDFGMVPMVQFGISITI